MKSIDKKIRRKIQTWSDDEILIALQEARERLDAPVFENFPKPSMDSKGNLAVKFQNDVKFPSYLVKDIKGRVAEYENSGKQDQGDAKTERRLRRDRRLGIFDTDIF